MGLGRKRRIGKQSFWEEWKGTRSRKHENRGTVAECPRVAACR